MNRAFMRDGCTPFRKRRLARVTLRNPISRVQGQFCIGCPPAPVRVHCTQDGESLLASGGYRVR